MLRYVGLRFVCRHNRIRYATKLNILRQIFPVISGKFPIILHAYVAFLRTVQNSPSLREMRP